VGPSFLLMVIFQDDRLLVGAVLLQILG
jgi:hypothetical protein